MTRPDRHQTNFDEILTPENPRNSRDSAGHGHHNSLNGGHHHHKTRITSGHRQNKAVKNDDCYCVPVDQCPSFSVVTDSGKPVKDYSDLINPRVLPKDIVAETEDADTLDLSAGELSTKSESTYDTSIKTSPDFSFGNLL